MGKVKGNKPSYQKKTKKQEKKEPTKQQKNVGVHSLYISIFVAVILVIFFVGRWMMAIMNGYFNAYVKMGDSFEEAYANVGDLDVTEEEETLLLEAGKEWDYFTSSRLCDQLTMTASDGTELTGYLYDEGSDLTLVVIPQLGVTGTDDFLPGTYVNEETGCNILLLDVRCQGESGGEYFSYGYYEKQDLADWLEYMTDSYGEQSYLIWGCGTGANTALFAEAAGLLDGNVLGIVAESPYGSLHEVAYKHLFDWYTIPSIPFLSAIEWRVNHSNAGFTMADTNLNNTLSEANCDKMVLFLTSDEDTYILPEWTQEAYDAYSGEKELLSGTGSHGTVATTKQGEILEWIQECIH